MTVTLIISLHWERFTSGLLNSHRYIRNVVMSKMPLVALRVVEASNVINDPKCNKGPKCNNFWP